MILGIVRTISYSFSTLDSLLILYLNVVRLKSEYASTVKNYRMSTEGKNLESIQWKFVAQPQNCYYTNDHVEYENLLKFLKLHTLHNSRVYLDALFFISVYLGLNTTVLFWILLVFVFYIFILVTPPCLLLLATTLRPLEALGLLTCTLIDDQCIELNCYELLNMIY